MVVLEAREFALLAVVAEVIVNAAHAAAPRAAKFGPVRGEKSVHSLALNVAQIFDEALAELRAVPPVDARQALAGEVGALVAKFNFRV